MGTLTVGRRADIHCVPRQLLQAYSQKSRQNKGCYLLLSLSGSRASVRPGDDSSFLIAYSPLLSISLLCAPCHGKVCRRSCDR